MKAGYFFSDEPGYYEQGKFGIRLETVLLTIKKNNLPHGKIYILYSHPFSRATNKRP